MEHCILSLWASRIQYVIGTMPRLGSAGFQPAVSPTSSRLSAEPWKAPEYSARLRIGNPRYSRLEVCATVNRCRVLALALTALALTTTAHATVTNVAWYRLGENDPGAASGQIVNSTTIDFVGPNNLRRTGSPRYTNDVSPDAAQIGSTLGVVFNGINQLYNTNAVVTTAQNNFGIEAWVRTLTTADGTYVVAHNGNAAANGWGLQVFVTNSLFLGFSVTYFGEFGGGPRFGGGRPVSNALVHVAMVRDNGTSRFYLNGTASGSTSTTTPATPTGSFAIAADPPSLNALFPGIVDEVRVFTFAPGQFSASDLLVNQPVVTTLPATGFAPGTATLNGSAHSLGFATTVWFEWGDSTNLNNITTPQALGAGFTIMNFSEVLTGLTAGVTYRFRAVATNNLGIVFGSVRTFIIGPTVTTLPATNVTRTSATLNGTVNPNGLDTNARFEFGFSTNYGSVTPTQGLGTGNADTNLSTSVNNLISGVPYHFRAVASNSLGTTFGADQVFPSLFPGAYLKASNTGAGDNFGRTVAMDGDTLVIGAPGEDSSASGVNGDGSNDMATNSGAAYVFVRNGNSWVQQAYLKANNTGSGDAFGTSVAISGDTVVIGAVGEDSNATGVNGDGTNDNATTSGAAYIFVRNGTSWTQQAYLKASNTEAGDEFGETVTISGNTVIVGASGEDSNATGVNGNQGDNSITDCGAAYVFVRNGTTWSQQAYLKSDFADNGAAINGVALSLSGDTALLGFSGQGGVGKAYVFVRSGTTWTQQAFLQGSNTGFIDIFGVSVAVDGDTALVGAAFEDSTATGVNGTGTDPDLNFNSGAAYVFVRNGTTWTQQAYLKASNTGEDDLFGISVALHGNTAVVGARGESAAVTGVNGDGSNNSSPGAGAAYVFTRSGTTWNFQHYLKASNTGGSDLFGESVTVSGELVVVGARSEDSNATGINGDQSNNSAGDAGAAYVFEPPPPPFAEISVSQSGVNIPSGGSSQQYLVAGTNTESRIFAIRNTGIDFLTGLDITIDGPDATAFGVVSSPIAPLVPTGLTTVTLRFAPTHTGTSTATLHIASNDTDENPFDISLSGLSLSFTEDRDGDGLNDASELLMSSLGFNFQVNQSFLVNTLFNNANGAGLFTQSQLQALNVDTPLLAKDPNTGFFKLTIGVEKATQLTNFFPFPMSAPQTTINPDGKLEFQFTPPDNAAFFRLESR